MNLDGRANDVEFVPAAWRDEMQTFCLDALGDSLLLAFVKGLPEDASITRFIDRIATATLPLS
jgi:hypothetical protein